MPVPSSAHAERVQRGTADTAADLLLFFGRAAFRGASRQGIIQRLAEATEVSPAKAASWLRRTGASRHRAGRLPSPDERASVYALLAQHVGETTCIACSDEGLLVRVYGASGRSKTLSLPRLMFHWQYAAIQTLAGGEYGLFHPDMITFSWPFFVRYIEATKLPEQHMSVRVAIDQGGEGFFWVLNFREVRPGQQLGNELHCVVRYRDRICLGWQTRFDPGKRGERELILSSGFNVWAGPAADSNYWNADRLVEKPGTLLVHLRDVQLLYVSTEPELIKRERLDIAENSLRGRPRRRVFRSHAHQA